jgi:L-2,4-diaminobutyrate decarboxylase
MSEKKQFEGIWEKGSIRETGPKWALHRKIMTSEFTSPYRGDGDPLATAIMEAFKKLDNLRPEKGGPAYLGNSSKLNYEYPGVKNASMQQKGQALDGVIDDVIALFNGMPSVSSPLTMANVWPQPNTAAIIASLFSQVYMPNIIEGEYAWNVHIAELESAGMIAGLFGWSRTQAGCVYTYGGSGCWLYGLKYALARVLPGSRSKGVRTDGKVLVSTQAHYCQFNATDWTGLGMDNIIRIPTDPETNQMDVNELEKILKDLTSKGIPVIEVVCTMGTTDASVFDPIASVRRLLDTYPNPAPYGKALLYADSVAGWSWATFKDYDFAGNPLQFSDKVISIIRSNAAQIADIHYADAVGIDFHKFGWAPYVSSCFVYKDAAEFENILRRGDYAYLQEVTPYNPMYYTLEVSRAGSGALAGWATLKYFGIEGLQSILGGILETKNYANNLVEDLEDAALADPDNTGFITLFRVYSKGTDGKSQYARELTDPAYRADLIQNNQLTAAIGEKLFEWYLSGKQVNGKFTPHMAYSTGFRTTDYNRHEQDSEAVVYALKFYPMNVFVTPDDIRHALECVIAARDEVMKDQF